jgi:hypothetical protein
MDPLYQPPTAQKPPLLGRRMGLIIGGIVAAVVVAIVLMLVSGGNPQGENYARVVARQEALLDLIKQGGSKISSPDLNKLASDATLFVTSDLTTLEADLSRFGLKNIPPEIAAAESASKVEAELEEAELQNRFDSTYSELLLKKIDSQMSLLKSTHADLPESNIKTNVSSAYKSLQALQLQLETLQL